MLSSQYFLCVPFSTLFGVAVSSRNKLYPAFQTISVNMASGLQIFFNHPDCSNSSIFLIWWQTIKRKYWFLVFPAHTKASIPLLRDRFPFGTITQWGQKNNSTRIWIYNQIWLVSYFMANGCVIFWLKDVLSFSKKTLRALKTLLFLLLL